MVKSKFSLKILSIILNEQVNSISLYNWEVVWQKKWVYLFNEVEQAEKYVKGDWDKVRGLMGGKGANLAEMTRITFTSSTFLHDHHRSL